MPFKRGVWHPVLWPPHSEYKAVTEEPGAEPGFQGAVNPWSFALWDWVQVERTWRQQRTGRGDSALPLIMLPPNKMARRKQQKVSIHPHSTRPSCRLFAWGKEHKISAGCAPHLSCSLCPRVCCLLVHWRCNYLTTCRSLGKIAHFNQSTKWARLDDFTKCIWGEFCTAMSEYQVIKWTGNKFPRGVNKHTKSVPFRCCAEWGKWISEWTATQGSSSNVKLGFAGWGVQVLSCGATAPPAGWKEKTSPWREPCQMLPPVNREKEGSPVTFSRAQGPWDRAKTRCWLSDS